MLNVRQEKFCLEYAKCGNATEAAIVAGYAEKYAGQNADKLLKNTKIQDRLKELVEQLESEKIADIREMQQRLTSIIRQETTEETPMVVNNGNYSEVQMIEKTSSIKDIINAINTLGKMQGAFTEKVQVDMMPVIIKGEMPDDY